MRFEITWKDGRVEEVEQSDCDTVEQFVSCRFGSAGTRGASVTIVGAVGEEPAVEEPAVEEPAVEEPAVEEPVKKVKGK